MSDPLPKDDFNRWADRHDRQHGDLDGRLARDMVSMQVYLADQRAQERRLTELERDIADGMTRHDRDIAEISASKASIERVQRSETRLDAIEQRPANMRNYLVGLAGVALTLIGIVVSAYFSAKGTA